MLQVGILERVDRIKATDGMLFAATAAGRAEAIAYQAEINLKARLQRGLGNHMYIGMDAEEIIDILMGGRTFLQHALNTYEVDLKEL